MASSKSKGDPAGTRTGSSAPAPGSTPGAGTRESVWAPVSAGDRAAAFRAACRLFRGFDLLPDAVVELVRGFPHYFVARRGALSLREREIVARAITGEPPGSFGSDPRAVEDESHRGSRSLEAMPELTAREQQLSDFAAKITRKWVTVSLEDVELLMSAGYSPPQVREATDAALVFRVVHRLTRAASAHLPIAAGRRPALAAAAGARAGRARARSRDDDEEEAFLILPAAPPDRSGAGRKVVRAAIDARELR